PSAAQYPPRATRIATLKKVEKRITARETKHPYYGDIRVKDLRSFGVDALWNKGIDGAGTSVAVIEGWDLPGIQKTVNALDEKIGLPHAKIETVFPTGPLPKTCPAGMKHLGDYGSCKAWGGELTLDVEAVHFFAPYAKIVISATPADSQIADDASAQVAPPEMMKALEYLSTRKLADVISISDGSNEGDYSHGETEIRAQDPGELTAAAHGVPVVNGTGDCGAAQNLATATGFCNKLTKGRAVATWADSPYVTAVGGVTPDYLYSGRHGQDSFSVWKVSPYAAEGAGFSEVYARPGYQDRVASITHSGRRSLPDITMDGASGTSEATPQFAALLAMATQVRHHDLGPINAVLYDRLGRNPSAHGLIDVTKGNNSLYGVRGFAARRGYDVATGWGTVNAGTFVPALAKAVAATPRANSLQTKAAKALAGLTHRISAAPSRVSGGGTSTIRADGFLPAHPVTVSVDGKQVTTVTADAKGAATYALDASSVGTGRHVVRLSGLLISMRTTVSVTS
ncbi:S53 family peptidase, partial [Jatrophihabitans endophyticus]|uniref:S53 family peptidase n=1 Tax=Jatrophihabitans endophyticus TaxID=1206085 RepID=UPI0019EFE3C6